MAPKLSIVVPSFNGAKKIPTLLSALQKQVDQSFELIIVIDGSSDNTRQIVEATNTGFPIRIIEQTNQGRAITKNTGAKHATADLIVFYDDDMEPEPESVLKHMAFHAHYEGLLSGNQLEFHSKHKTDIQNYKASLSQKWTDKYRVGLNELNSSNLFFTAANCSIKKRDFLMLNGFDEELTDAEDFDLALRALQNNVKVYFDKSNAAIHHDSITCIRYIKRLREYHSAHQKVIQRNSSATLLATSSIPKWKAIIYAVHAYSWIPKLIDRFNLFMVLPKLIRFRFYNIVIHSLAKIHPEVPL